MTSYPTADTKPSTLKTTGVFPTGSDEPHRHSYTIGKDKTVTAKLTYFVDAGTGIALAQSFMNATLTHPTMTGSNWNISPVGGTVAGTDAGEKVDIDFKGVTEDGTWEPTFSGNASTEPIDTHPMFQAEIGGKLGDEKHGAMFSTNKAFSKFSNYVDPSDLPAWASSYADFQAGSTGKAKNPFAGVKSFLDCGLNWDETKFFTNVNQLKYLKNAGVRMSPVSTDPNPPQIRSKIGSGSGSVSTTKRDWINMGASWSMVGNGAQAGAKVTVKFRLSGPRGWDEDLYDGTPAAGTTT